MIELVPFLCDYSSLKLIKTYYPNTFLSSNLWLTLYNDGCMLFNCAYVHRLIIVCCYIQHKVE